MTYTAEQIAQVTKVFSGYTASDLAAEYDKYVRLDETEKAQIVWSVLGPRRAARTAQPGIDHGATQYGDMQVWDKS